jgi:quercetin dioxygenase-like cupin family protein
MANQVAARPYRWSEAEEDNPIPLLTRKRIWGEKMLLARVKLEKGCLVAVHTHESEQIAVLISGHVRWTVAGEQFEMGEGEVLHLASNVPHGIEALEDTEIIDILSPPGAMGVDSQTE